MALCDVADLHSGKFCFFSKTAMNPSILISDYTLVGFKAKQFLGLVPHIGFTQEYFKVVSIDPTNLVGLDPQTYKILESFYSHPNNLTNSLDVANLKNLTLKTKAAWAEVYTNAKIIGNTVDAPTAKTIAVKSKSVASSIYTGAKDLSGPFNPFK
jgi:hypothetical protein